MGRVYCGVNYTGSSCEDIYYNNPETGDKSGYFHVNDRQWTYCNMSTISNDDFISTCPGVGGGWRRIVNIDISAEDDCPGEWRKATQSGVSFCRVASDNDKFTCSSANFSTNGTSYQRVCGRARRYQKGHTLGFLQVHVKQLLTIMLMVYQSLITKTRDNIFGLLLVGVLKNDAMLVTVLVLVMQETLLLLSLQITTIVKQLH